MRYLVVLAMVTLLGSADPAQAEACLDLLTKPSDAAACIERSTKDAEVELAARLRTLKAQIAKQTIKATRRQMSSDLQEMQTHWTAFAGAECELEAKAASGQDDAPYAGSLCRRRLIDAYTKDVVELTKKLR
ncbi:Protein of unknown function [Arboricoccus pini]|uniref:Lysozyme inhibitor LprI-like N-terminal domain-containing protein n=1 Tax=Arboricoccus pini TaxID=1963835 RepID=A0A212QPD0_9PROT|nr:lysozyme inhibitor LprI family protein [Arboricoccus pini]SNB61306.1 Protein of unknown function [Arboricoccus pini]